MDDLENQKPIEDSAEPKQSETEPKARNWDRIERRSPRNGAWIGGIILILLGVIFILQNMNIPLFANWWALFILIPAIASFSSAWNIFHNHDNQFTSAVISTILFGILLTFVAIIFLLNLSWDYMWPVILILIGISIFIGSFIKKE